MRKLAWGDRLSSLSRPQEQMENLLHCKLCSTESRRIGYLLPIQEVYNYA